MTEDEISIDDHIWLFTEDLTNFVFRNNIGFPITPIADECREFVQERFTETVRGAVEIAERKVSAEIEAVFLELSANGDVIEAYTTYVSDLRKELRSGGFDGSKFLHYCVFVSCLGERFYRTGSEDFYYLAFAAVRKGLEMCGMSEGEWGSLESASNAITTVAEENLPSQIDEKSGLEVNTGQGYVNRTLNILHEDIDCLSESSLSKDSSSVEYKSSDTESSAAQTFDICNTSEDDSESVSSDDQYLISLNKNPSQSNTVSSSTDISKSFTVSNSCSRAHRVESSGTAHLKFTMNDFVEPLDLSKHFDRNESCSEFNLNATSSGQLSVSATRDKKNKTASRKVCTHSKNSSESEDTEEEKRALFHSPQVKQFSKQNSESCRFRTDCELSAEARSPNSAESTSSVFERSKDDRATCEGALEI